MRQKVIRVQQGKFRVFWDSERLAKQALILDFNPFIRNFNLTPPYCLLHWQARPFGWRRWGIYDSSDEYYGVDYDSINIETCEIKLLQLDERQLTYPPSAVVLLKDVKYKGDKNVRVGT